MPKEQIEKPGRSLWKGYLKLSLVSCAVALYKATSTVEKVSFNTLNKSTGNRLKQLMIDSVTEAPVEHGDRVKGYQVGKNQYVMILEEELEAIRPPGDKVIGLEKFVPLGSIEAAYMSDRYYVVPDDPVAEEAFAVIQAALAKKQVVGIGNIVLRSRQRPVMLEPLGAGLVATTLRHTAEVRSAATVFAGIRKVELPKEMLEIAQLLIDRKTGTFDPAAFVDQYEEQVIELIRSKQAGQVFKTTLAEGVTGNVVNLLDALKRSLAEDAAMPRIGAKGAAKGAKEAAAPKKKPARTKAA